MVRSSLLRRLLKNAHLLRFPHPSSLRRTSKYASFLRISGALHLGIFEQPAESNFFRTLLGAECWEEAFFFQGSNHLQAFFLVFESAGQDAVPGFLGGHAHGN